MAGRLIVKERAQIAARFEVWNSVVAVQRWWRGAGLRRRSTGKISHIGTTGGPDSESYHQRPT